MCWPPDARVEHAFSFYDTVDIQWYTVNVIAPTTFRIDLVRGGQVVDIIATDEQLGKPAGNDLVEGIYTLPVIHSLADPVVARELRPLLTPAITTEERDRARDLVRDSEGVTIALDVARTWADKAAATLSALPDTPGARALRAASDHLIERVAAPLGRKRFSRKPR